MEKAFLSSWADARQKAAELGVHLREMDGHDALRIAHRCLSGHRESDGFASLAALQRLDLSLEKLATDPRFTALFTDEEVNTALSRLLDAGYYSYNSRKG